MSATRRAIAVCVLALGAFGIGLTEFVAMGLLPDIAASVLPGVYAQSVPTAVAQAGWVITAYAAGVVVGAPLVAMATPRMRRTHLVAGLLGLFAVGTAASALAPTFALLVAFRFLSGLPHGAFMGAAGMLAAQYLDGSQARGFASVLGGLCVANVVGVPAITALGHAAGWRIATAAIFVLFALTLVAALLLLPPVRTPPGSARTELRTLIRPRVWLVTAIIAIGTSGFFSAFSYIAPVTTDIARLPATAVPWVMATLGLGMTVGTLLGGLVGDRAPRRWSLIGFGAVVAAMLLFAVAASTPVGLFTAAFLIGVASLFIAPTLQGQLIHAAHGTQLIGAALSQSAFNTANSICAAAGGFVIARGLGFLAPAWVGVALATAGLLIVPLAVPSGDGDRRRATVHHRPQPQPQPQPSAGRAQA